MADNNSTLRTRAEAKALGLTRYFTGKPCVHGHVGERFTSAGTCYPCLRITHAKYKSESPEKYAEAVARAKAKRALRHDELLDERRARKRIKAHGLERKQTTRAIDKAARDAALANGDRFYQSVRPCKYGHIGQKAVRSYGCVTCSALLLRPEPDHVIAERAERRAAQAAKRAKREHYAAIRDAACARGLTTYMGAPCDHGHDGLRWVCNFSCVACLQTEERRQAKREYDRVYCAANSTRKTAQSIKWVKENPERRRSIVVSYDSRRRAHKKDGATTAEIHEWRRTVKKICYWCGVKCAKGYHLDHYHPLSKGGTHTVDNFVVSCGPCNLKKNAKDPYEFAQSVGRLF